ncbi:hypothetical protein ACFVAD_18130 [Sutcliffiella sp. NPDC057660]|uniref:hypothetical protein n=1 Tax=Sutcliffiella sp. NPDC057660 TaxID=3346199 RepID=UPI00368C4312
MKRNLVLLVLIPIFFVGCQASTTLNSLERVSVQEIQTDSLLVDCSATFEKPFWASSQEAIMYLCEVTVSNQTKLTDEDGNNLTLESFQENTVVNVILNKETKLGKNDQRQVEAQEIILLKDNDNYVIWAERMDNFQLRESLITRLEKARISFKLDDENNVLIKEKDVTAASACCS